MKQTVEQINQAIRDNPLAASLIGVGLFMTFFGNAGIPKLAAKLPEAAKGAARSAAMPLRASPIRRRPWSRHPASTPSSFPNAPARWRAGSRTTSPQVRNRSASG